MTRVVQLPAVPREPERTIDLKAIGFDSSLSPKCIAELEAIDRRAAYAEQMAPFIQVCGVMEEER